MKGKKQLNKCIKEREDVYTNRKKEYGRTRNMIALKALESKSGRFAAVYRFEGLNFKARWVCCVLL